MRFMINGDTEYNIKVAGCTTENKELKDPEMLHKNAELVGA